MDKIGIILSSLHDSQLAYGFIKSINNFLLNSVAYDFVIFFENLSMPLLAPSCAVMTSNEVAGFDGMLISTTLNNTLLSIKSIGPTKKIFYINDLEWLRGHNDFIRNLSIYRHPSIELVCRSQSHAKAVANYCNRMPTVLKCEIKEFINAFS